MNREMLGEIEKLKSDVRWLEGALNSQAIERDRLVKEMYDLRAEIERLRAENDQAISDAQTLEQEAHQLYNVLAVIHRDGGHYAHEHGAIKASEDAINEVIRLRSEIERLKWLEKTTNRAGHLSIAMQEIERLTNLLMQCDHPECAGLSNPANGKGER
jgi:uncharacterized coiled-coil DUF342 family protein